MFGVTALLTDAKATIKVRRFFIELAYCTFFLNEQEISILKNKKSTIGVGAVPKEAESAHTVAAWYREVKFVAGQQQDSLGEQGTF